MTIILWIVGVILAYFFFLFIVLKIVARITHWAGYSVPCPPAFSWYFESRFRKWYMRPVLDRLGIRPGDKILELGPGPGAFTVDAARRAGPEGRLIVIDIQPEMIAKVKKRLRAADVANAETHVARAYDLPLSDSSINRAFLVTVLGEIADQSRALAELSRVIRPGGILSITEEWLDPDYPFAGETIRRAKSAGFRLCARFGNFLVYTLNFEKN
jgi:ubiquinone/menaquinone biosynthesis C-methylase UbiE